MSKPVIVCDIDDVVFPFIDGMTDHYNTRYGGSLTADDFISFDFTDVWGGTQEAANNIVEEFLHTDTLHLLPLEGVIEAFERLHDDFDIVMVTARNGIFQENTTTWLRTHLPDLFSHAIFAGNYHDGRGYRTKGEICKELGAVLIIDDHPANVASAVENGTGGILFGTKQWTLEGVKQSPEVKHCVNWSQVMEYIYGEWQSK
jgi:5'(3')-deoxyribonucleotidase